MLKEFVFNAINIFGAVRNAFTAVSGVVHKAWDVLATLGPGSSQRDSIPIRKMHSSVFAHTPFNAGQGAFRRPEFSLHSATPANTLSFTH